MNIFGRVFGGLLVLISLGWLATIAGIRPGGFANQINSTQGTTTNNLTTGTSTGTSAQGAKNTATTGTTANNAKASTFNTSAGNTAGKSGSGVEVEKDPRSNTQPTKAANQTTPASTGNSAPAASAPAAAPVSAGW